MWKGRVRIYDTPRVHNNFPTISSKLALSFIKKWPKLGRGLTSLNEKWCKACGTRWSKRKEEEKKETKAIWPCGKLKQTESHFGWVLEWAKNTEKREFQLERYSPKRLRETQWECERLKKKNETFFFVQATHKKDKLVEFSWSFWVLQPWRVGVSRGRFCYWYCGEIVFYSLRFNLLCIQFIVDSSLA